MAIEGNAVHAQRGAHDIGGQRCGLGNAGVVGDALAEADGAGNAHDEVRTALVGGDAFANRRRRLFALAGLGVDVEGDEIKAIGRGHRRCMTRGRGVDLNWNAAAE